MWFTKNIAKIFNNWLSLLLSNIISPNQASFVKNSSISNNALIGLNIMHHIYSKSNLNMARNLDIAKAFDEVNWGYLEQMPHKFHFRVLII